MRGRVHDFLKNHRAILVILIVGLLIRISYLALYSNLPEWFALTVDNYYHHNWARAIADGNWLGSTTWFRAPFYIYSLGLLYKFFGISLWVGRLFGLAIGIASITTTYLIAKKVYRHKSALIAAALHALYPIVIYFESELLLDPLFTLLVQLSLLFFLRSFNTTDNRNICFSGFILGLAALTRPTALVFILPMLYYAFKLTMTDRKRPIRKVVLFLLPVFLCLMVSFTRNMVVADDPVLISSQGGINFYLGNNPAADGLSAVMPEPMGFNWRIAQITHEANTVTGNILSPGQVSSFWFWEAVDWIKRAPGDFIALYFGKLYWSISNYEISNNRNLSNHFSKISLLKYNPLRFSFIFMLAVIGYWASRKEKWEVRLLGSLIAIYILITSLFFFNSRFRLPLLPFYFVLASAGARYLWLTVVKRSFHAALPIGIIAGLVSIIPLVDLPAKQSRPAEISAGIHLYHQGKYRQAIDRFQKSAAIEPDFPELNLNLGVCYLKLGNEDSARYYLRKELAVNPGRVKAYTNLASIALLGEQFSTASALVDSVLATEPYDLTANLISLRAVFGGADTLSANLQKQIEQAAVRTSENVYLLNEAASLLLQRNDYEYAQTLLLRAVRSTPPPVETDDAMFTPVVPNRISLWRKQQAQSCFNLGFIAGQAGHVGAAIDWSFKAVRLDQDLIKAYVNLVTGLTTTRQQHKADSVRQAAFDRFGRELPDPLLK